VKNYSPKPNIAPLGLALATTFRDMKSSAVKDLALDLDDIDCACKIISHKVNLIRRSRRLRKDTCLQLINDINIWITFEMVKNHLPRVKFFLKKAYADTVTKPRTMARKKPRRKKLEER